MRITWLGQAAFLLEGDGLRVVTDPFTPEIMGYPPIREAADVVVRSSDDDQAHCRADLVPGEPAVIDALEVAAGTADGAARGLSVRAVLAAEWEHHPEHAPERCAMYRFALGGVDVAHMGDIGNDLTDEQVAFLEGADVLLALAGGPPTVSLPELDRVIRAARPRLVIPMHFRTLTYRPRNLHWIERFLADHDEEHVDFACSPTAEIEPASLPDPTRVLVLDYLR